MQINTFFMIWSLCQLLQRSEEKHKLKYISVEFSVPPIDKEQLHGRRAIAKAEHYLWDPLVGTYIGGWKPFATRFSRALRN